MYNQKYMTYSWPVVKNVIHISVSSLDRHMTVCVNILHSSARESSVKVMIGHDNHTITLKFDEGRPMVT